MRGRDLNPRTTKDGILRRFASEARSQLMNNSIALNANDMKRYGFRELVLDNDRIWSFINDKVLSFI
jgi:hypothetical protein